ncbi:unnamed protein product [Microthlaspi erraticum]|uniref:Integrase catalytic domain-containing protein n=1 Tax=Microthlaspi erraticum TaxID=1685480 RepID=A0A6D2IA79_9BRAS|nr:unnamed protein product [Microthlaspi erraticum]
MFQSDGGGEFISKAFLQHLQNSGIQHLVSCPHTPQQNGLVERKHRYLTELGLSMMFQRKMPAKYWVEAFFTSNYLTNLLPTFALQDNASPYQKMFGSIPVYTALRTFGCACYPTLRDYMSHKFDPKSLKCVFLGYSAKHKGYRCLYPPTGRVYLSRHVIFDESVFPFQNVYSTYHSPANTNLSKAWQQSFVPSSNNTTSTHRNSSSVAPTTSSPVSAKVPIVQDELHSELHDLSTSPEDTCIGRTPCLDHDAIGDSVLSSVAGTDNTEDQSDIPTREAIPATAEVQSEIYLQEKQDQQLLQFQTIR